MMRSENLIKTVYRTCSLGFDLKFVVVLPELTVLNLTQD